MPSNKIIGRISSDPNIYGKVGEINGVKDHNRLANRSLPDQHPIDAITGLREELEKRDPATNQKIKVWDAANEEYINFGANDEVILIAGNNISFDVITEEQENNEEELQIPSITINSTLDPKNQRVKTGTVIFDADATVNIIADNSEDNPIEVAGDNDPSSHNYNSISIKHKEVIAAEPVAKKIGRDKYGHVTFGSDLKTSDLTNNGDGSDNYSPFATQKWVDTNGGKIDSISIDGTAQQIIDKNVDLLIYTKTETDTLLNAKQDIINQNNKLSSDLVDDTNKTHKFVTAAEKINIADNTSARHTHSNKAVLDGITAAQLTQIATNANNITAIQNIIPKEASTENELADKEFVNSSISTATANFKGTFNIIDDLDLDLDATEQEIAAKLAIVVNNATLNDYVFIAYPDPIVTDVFTKFDRYKYNNGWGYEYTLNNSSFTASQWAAINSGITVQLVQDITDNKSAIATAEGNITTLQGQVSNLDTAVGSIESDINDIELSLANKYEKPVNGIPKTDLAQSIKDSLDLADSALQSVPSEYITETELATELEGYVESSDLAAVATSGDYGDLDNKPDLTVYAKINDLATVATSGDYDDLIDKPDLSIYAESSALADVAFSGDYNDLDNKPEATKEYLEITAITGVSGITTASKATQGTAVVYGTADVDTAVEVVTDSNAYKAEYNANKCSLKLTVSTLTKSSITPAKAAPLSQTIPQYTFADVTVPIADQSATTVATGNTVSQGDTHGMQVVTDFGEANNN